MLTGLIFDEYGHPFTPVFTSKDGRQYRYYFNETLGRDKAHPDKKRSRFPAHEIESVIEKALRQKLADYLEDPHDPQSAFFLKQQGSIPAYDLVRTLVSRVALKAIAKREGCSQDYVGSAIFFSFKTLIHAF